MQHQAYVHHAYYAAHASGAGGNWFLHLMLAGLVHSAIYHMLSPLFRGQGLLGSLLIGAAIIAAVYVVWRRLSQPRMTSSVTTARRWRS